MKEGGDPIEKTVCSHAFIAYRSSIRLYRLREEARAEAGPGPGSSTAASGTRTRARARTRARTCACEAGKEVIHRGICQLTTL